MRIQINLSTPDVMERIAGATEAVEEHLGQCLVAQTWDMFVDDNPDSTDDPRPLLADSTVEILKMPVLSVTGVYVTDEAGAETTVSTSSYWVSSFTKPCRIALRQGNLWPAHRNFEGFRIRTVCGYAFPFTVASNVITSPGHTLTNGQVIRLQRGVGELPTPLLENTDYTVSGVSANTLALKDSTGSTITITEDRADYCLLGEVPRSIRRAIIITANLQNARKGNDTPHAPVMLPEKALEMLDGQRRLSII